MRPEHVGGFAGDAAPSSELTAPLTIQSTPTPGFGFMQTRSPGSATLPYTFMEMRDEAHPEPEDIAER